MAINLCNIENINFWEKRMIENDRQLRNSKTLWQSKWSKVVENGN